MYHSSKWHIGEGKEEVFRCRRQEGMDDWVAVRTEWVRAQQTTRNQQLGDLLDREIELIRRIMLKVSQRKTSARKRSSSNKMKTETDCKSAVSGAIQHKIWRPGEKQQTTDIDDKLQNKVWDPDGQRFQTHDQEIMIIFNLGSLMQEH